MFFFIGISNNIFINSTTSAQDIIPYLINKLNLYFKDIAYIHNIQKSEKEIKFRASPFRFIWNGWNLFNPIYQGKFRINGIGSLITINYTVIFLEYFIYGLLFSILALTPMFPTNTLRFLYLFLIWALYIFHIFWTRFRINKFLRKITMRVIFEYLRMNNFNSIEKFKAKNLFLK